MYARKYPISNLRKAVGLVFQYPENQLFGKTVLIDTMYAPKNLGMSDAEAEAQAKESLSLVGIDEALYHRSPLELSGGQKRCVAIAGVCKCGRAGATAYWNPTDYGNDKALH